MSLALVRDTLKNPLAVFGDLCRYHLPEEALRS